jgi:hypothetical protein
MVGRKRNEDIREEVGVTDVDTAIKIPWPIDPLQSGDSKQRTLLGNICNTITAFPVVRAAVLSGQRLGKHVLAMKNTNARIEERCFL